MTIAVDLGRKATKQTKNKQGRCLFYYFTYFIRFGLKDIVMTSLRH